MSYTNATFYVDMVSGSNAARTALTSCTASNPSGTITRINKTAHGLVTGAVVDATLFSAWLNTVWKITVVDADNFDLDGAVWQTTADASGTITPRGGSSKADAWADPNYATSSSRCQAGDTVRVKKTGDPTSVGDATWTQNSITVTLPSAVTANISNCDTGWTASANVTPSLSSTGKEGANCVVLAIASAFTTGKVAYFATGSLDLSGYQQVSFWFAATAAITAGSISLRLCTDTTGDVSVHTIPIPATGSISGLFMVVTHDFGSNLNSAIQSVAVYQDTNVAGYTVALDNIIACKASSSADSLTLSSVIGKVHNLSWQASTSYATNDKRCPTTAKRRGFQYQATTGGTSGSTEPVWPEVYGETVSDGSVVWTNIGVADTWYSIRSISGTTLILDGGANTRVGTGRGYHGDTETIATYKREPYRWIDTGWAPGLSGTANSRITLSGGWDSSTMSSQDGETWLSAENGRVVGVNLASGSRQFWTVNSMSFSRYSDAISAYSDNTFQNCHFISPNGDGIGSAGNYFNLRLYGVALSQGADNAFETGPRGSVEAAGLLVAAFAGRGLRGEASSFMKYDIRGALVTRMGLEGIAVATSVTSYFNGVTLKSNGLASHASAGTIFHNCEFLDFDPQVNVNCERGWLFAQRYGKTADDHRLIGTPTPGSAVFLVRSATDRRHTASGISWKFSPSNTRYGAAEPLELSLAKIACAAGVTRTVKIWTNRDNANIHGRLLLRGSQTAGIAEQYVDSDPTVDTWVETSTLTFTATEAGVVEVVFQVWDGVGTTNNYWIDDITVT